MELASGETVAFFKGARFQLIDFLGDLVEFLLQPVIGLYVHGALHQDVDGVVKVLLGGIQMAGFGILLTS